VHIVMRFVIPAGNERVCSSSSPDQTGKRDLAQQMNNRMRDTTACFRGEVWLRMLTKKQM
jgi:hypothetical protein